MQTPPGFEIIEDEKAPKGRRIVRTPDNPEPVIGIGTDSADQLSDKQLRQAIKAVTGKRAPLRASRETLIKRYNELNEG